MAEQYSNFEQLVSPYHTSLRSYAMNFTRDEEKAADLVQDTLLKAFRYFANFSPETNLRGWLFTIMKNTFINDYRKNVRAQKVVTAEQELSSAQLYASSTRNAGEAKFINADIAQALESLPKNLYDPFVLYFEGYKYHEIAEDLAIPIGTVKTRIHYARIHLKKYLKVYEDYKGKNN